MRSHQHFKTALAVTATLAVVAASAVSGHSSQAGWLVQPNPDQQGVAPAAAATPTPTTLVVKPNADQQAPTPAAAITPSPTTLVVQPNPDQQPPLSGPATIVHVTNPNGGFNWADAGIGAAGALGLAMLTAAGALAISQRRARRTRGSLRTIN